jgi:hypothetical protein
MASFPTISNGFTITTASNSLSYQQIVNSLASWQYKAKELYLYSNFQSQLSNTYTFLKQTSDGHSLARPDSISLSPYQYQNAFYWKFEEGKNIFDNNTFFQFNLNPYASLQLMFYVDFHNAGSLTLGK